MGLHKEEEEDEEKEEDHDEEKYQELSQDPDCQYWEPGQESWLSFLRMWYKK